MFLGATGSGKSTLINGMINYILGINWKDSFRFKLIDEGQLKSQAESQTSHVTAYKVNYQDGFQVPYSLTLVDTPGFGDTWGIERDRAITEQIRRLFTSVKGVCEIDAVCFVTQASLARLTATQKYVFDSVLSIFGKDVAENICILVTFADGQQPPVLEAINASKVPCPKTDIGLPVHHKFNNSALFADNRSVCDRANEDSDEEMEVDNFDEMFWAMGVKSMKTFFSALDKMTTQSLQLTKEVLKERRQLEAAVEGLQPQVRAGLAKLEEIRSTQRQIEKHNADITSNENFQIEVEVIKPVQILLTKKGEYITNCQQCSMTCHYPCAIADNLQKRGCAAMKDGKCTVCPGKCDWNIHFNQKYRWDYVKEKQMKTVQDLKEKYAKATKAKITVQQLIENQEEEIANLQDMIMAPKESHLGGVWPDLPRHTGAQCGAPPTRTGHGRAVQAALEPPAAARTATPAPAPPERQRRPAEERGGSAATATGNRLLLASPGSSLEQPRPAAPLPGDQEPKAPCSRRRWEGSCLVALVEGGDYTNCSRPSESYLRGPAVGPPPSPSSQPLQPDTPETPPPAGAAAPGLRSPGRRGRVGWACDPGEVWR
ncbi:hypothetical protein N1851_006056 [Merluccius polli]|uniref:AIG1-type G domain-containing protein n=1 Tax=Merluccius polli TaxID=89951 RepID=A0AA47N546_MERPO|nr:hypothetical protein N1851_006056 [Merluccius polli]